MRPDAWPSLYGSRVGVRRDLAVGGSGRRGDPTPEGVPGEASIRRTSVRGSVCVHDPDETFLSVGGPSSCLWAASVDRVRTTDRRSTSFD